MNAIVNISLSSVESFLPSLIEATLKIRSNSRLSFLRFFFDAGDVLIVGFLDLEDVDFNTIVGYGIARQDVAL